MYVECMSHVTDTYIYLVSALVCMLHITSTLIVQIQIFRDLKLITFQSQLGVMAACV